MLVRLGDVTLIGAVDDRGLLGSLAEHPAFIAAAEIDLHPEQVRALWAILIERCQQVDGGDVPLHYGVADKRLWGRPPEPHWVRWRLQTFESRTLLLAVKS